MLTDLWTEILPALRSGAWITIQVTALAAAWGTAVAVVLGVASLSPVRPLRWLIRVYVEVLRGVSAIILLFWVFFALPRVGPSLTPMQAGVLALGLNLSAYGTEIVRGAVQAVPHGQTEAAVAVHLSPLQRIWSVTLPQAAVTILPPYGSLLIEVMKASALVSLINLADIMFVARDLRNQADSPSSVSIFTAVLILYFLIAYGITLVVRLLERRFGRGLDTGRMAGAVK
jgi:polar amino acid transport system permease protein